MQLRRELEEIGLELFDEGVLCVFGLKRPDEFVVLDELQESRMLQRPVFLLVVHEDGLCLNANRTVFANGVRVLLFERFAVLGHPLTRSLRHFVHSYLVTEAQAVLTEVGQDAR